MTGPAGLPGTAVPRWLPWAFVALLVLPFHPFWIDTEQVRRGLLLVLCGASLLIVPKLPRVRGDSTLLALAAFLVVAALISIRSLQEWEAIYRIAHWVALLVVLRLGAAAPAGFGPPLAAVVLLTSLFGLLQRCGVAEFCGYGAAREPVSVFGNLNVASEWTAIAATAVAVLPGIRPWLWQGALLLAGAYLVVNQSRSGLIALPGGLLVLFAKRRTLASGCPFVLALAGALIGLVLADALPRPAPADQQAELAEKKRATSTLDVRLEIARGSGKLFAERPLYGWGPGQFAVQYPRVRSETEIEASSHGRQFATEVRTAHDDWLELLVEGGVPALLLFALALFVLQRGATDKTRFLPLFVLLLLMFVRAPIGNAPAVAAALLLVGSPAAPRHPRPWAPWLARLTGLLLAGLGVLPVVAHCLFAPYVAAVAAGEQPPLAAARRASSWMWWEPRWLQIQAQEYLQQGNLAAATRAAAQASKLRPHDPELYKLVAEVLAKGGELTKADLVARHALQIDPPHPELRVLRSTVLLQQKRYDEAIAAVVTDPHPMLRDHLVAHFRSLARLAEQRGDATGAARCAVERDFLLAVEALGDRSAAGVAASSERVQALLVSMRAAGTLLEDLRALAVSALQFLDLDQPDAARDAGARAKELGITMPAWQRALFGDKLAPLLEQEVWFEVLRAR